MFYLNKLIILCLLLFMAFLCRGTLETEILSQYELTRSNPCILTVKGESQGGYYVKIGLGSPIQDLKLLIDTGSSNLAVSASPESENPIYFNYNDSETFHPTDQVISIEYTEGKWEGFLASDIISLCSGLSLRADIGCITLSSGIFTKYPIWQGVMGLGFKAIVKPENVEPFLDSVFESHNMSNLFSLSLCGPYLNSEQMETSSGKLYLGGIDSKLYEGDIIYTPLVKKWYYEVTIINMKVDDKSIPLACTEINNDKTIVDSGTSHLSLPKKVFTWLTEEIRLYAEMHSLTNFPPNFWTGESEGCVKHAKNISAFPSITLDFLHGKDSAFSLLISPQLYLYKMPSLQNKKLCFKLGFVISNSGTVIGASVLKGFHVVFDRDKSRVGFANSTCKSESSSPAGVVLKPYYSKEDLFDCLYHDETSKSLKVFAYVIGFIAVICAIPILTMLLRWIWRHLILRDPLSSENSSLVGDD